MKLHHLGIATNNFDEAEDHIHKIYEVKSNVGPIWDPNLNANLMLFNISNSYFIELVSGPAVENILKKRINLYHFCYEVNDFENSVNKYIESGSTLIIKPTPALLFENRLVAFLFTPLGIVELLSKY